MSKDIEIRREQPGDADAIADVVCRAFGSMGEANLVRLLRDHMPEFDPRYSVTAWAGDEMIGHTLFNPATVRVMGRTVRALNVAPVAVAPGWQRKGVGGAMLASGHELGASEGYEFAYLLGHPTYYPRHGYRACYGGGSIAVDADSLPEPSEKLSPWPVRRADIPWLMKCFAEEWANVDFSWQMGSTLDEWALPGTDARIWWTEDSRRAAYALRHPMEQRMRMLLADDLSLAQDVIAAMRPSSLDHHPAGSRGTWRTPNGPRLRTLPSGRKQWHANFKKAPSSPTFVRWNRRSAFPDTATGHRHSCCVDGDIWETVMKGGEPAHPAAFAADAKRSR